MIGLASTLADTMRQYHDARAVGVSHEDACLGLEAVLRDVLPLSHYPAWCVACDDSGWEPLDCNGRQCGRTWEHGPHGYVVECPCRSSNQTYQRRLTEQRERASGRAAKRDAA